MRLDPVFLGVILYFTIYGLVYGILTLFLRVLGNMCLNSVLHKILVSRAVCVTCLYTAHTHVHIHC